MRRNKVMYHCIIAVILFILYYILRLEQLQNVYALEMFFIGYGFVAFIVNIFGKIDK